MDKKQILKIIVSVLIAALTALGAAIGLNSCNVVRTITNKSEFYQRTDSIPGSNSTLAMIDLKI